MTLQQLNLRVQQEADARFGETIEHLLFLLEYNQRMKEVAVKCYCDERSTHTTRLCGYCLDEEEHQWGLLNNALFQ